MKAVNPDDEFDMANYDNEEDDEAMAQRIFGAGLGGVAFYAKPEVRKFNCLNSSVFTKKSFFFFQESLDSLVCAFRNLSYSLSGGPVYNPA